jgi:hypothetical protein
MAAKDETPPPQGLIAYIGDAVSRGGLTHDTVLELVTLRQKAAELQIGITKFHNDVPPSLADALDRAEVAL